MLRNATRDCVLTPDVKRLPPSMANFIGDWIFSDLTAYNITILPRDAAALFGQEALQGLYHLSIPMEMADMKYNRLSGV